MGLGALVPGDGVNLEAPKARTHASGWGLGAGIRSM